MKKDEEAKKRDTQEKVFEYFNGLFMNTETSHSWSKIQISILFIQIFVYKLISVT